MENDQAVAEAALDALSFGMFIANSVISMQEKTIARMSAEAAYNRGVIAQMAEQLRAIPAEVQMRYLCRPLELVA